MCVYVSKLNHQEPSKLFFQNIHTDFLMTFVE